MTYKEWAAEGEKRFGPDKRKWRFTCPSCSHVASVEDWLKAKAPEGAVAFSCVGRQTKASDKNSFKNKGGPCTYAGGGLFRLNPIIVVGDMNGGETEHQLFAFAD
jgi:hypothetical protein